MTSCTFAEVNVRYNFSVQRSIGTESELARNKFFNIHANPAYGPIEVKDHEWLKDYGVTFGRGFNGPFWYFRGKDSLESPFPTDGQAAAMSRAITDLYETQITYPYLDRRTVVTDHPRDTFHMDMDLEAAAQWTVSFFKHFYNDASRPMFYEPMNEPFVHAKDFGDDDNQVIQRMSELYREIGKAFDASDLDVKVVGYASAWPSMELKDFWHWNTRMKLFMDVAGDYMDGISTHLYDGTNVTGQDNRRSGANAEAILDLIETYSFIKWGYVKPHAITEFGDIPKGYPEYYTPEKSSQEHRAYNHILFNLFERQDRILTAIPFITTKSPWFYEETGRYEAYLADLWRPDAESVVKGQVQNYFFTKKIDFYELWKNVRGERSWVHSDNPDIAAVTFVDGARTFICLNNLDDYEQTIRLHNQTKQGTLQSARLRRLNVPPREAGIYTDKPLQYELDVLTLQPYETAILVYDYAQPLSFKKAVTCRTHYSKSHLLPIQANVPLVFSFNDLPDTCIQASLRFSIGRKPDRSRKPLLTINGNNVEVPDNWAGYDQGNRKDFFGAIPVSLPVDHLDETVTVELSFPDDGGRVSSVVLITESID
ncbi:MAG: T9SS C-terminal target domain-containing protein [Coraliomargaritaceae bacterium]